MRPFAGVVYVSLIAFAAHAIEGGDVSHAAKEFEPGSLALIGAAAVYAARSIYELIQQRQSAAVPADAGVQRLVDLYQSHAAAEERILTSLDEAMRVVRDTSIRAAVQAEANAAMLARLNDGHAAISQAIAALNSAVQRCSGGRQ